MINTIAQGATGFARWGLAQGQGELVGGIYQELIVPVLTVRSQRGGPSSAKQAAIEVANLPYQITNRIFSVRVQLGGQLAMFSEPSPVLPLLLSGAEQAGHVGMATGASLDPVSGTVSLVPGQPADIAFLLTDDRVDAVRIVVRDPATDAPLYSSPQEIPVKLGVG